ncbi:MAG: hypothetical protein ACRCYQ_09605 [Nocardioides sp.]
MLRFLLFALIFFAAVYVGVRAAQRRGLGPSGGGSQARRPLGPDDDPDFLRGL